MSVVPKRCQKKGGAEEDPRSWGEHAGYFGEPSGVAGLEGKGFCRGAMGCLRFFFVQMRHLNPYIEGEDEGPFPSGVSVQDDAEGEDDDGSDAHTNATFEEFDTQTVTVPITLCLAIMVG